MQVRTVVRDSIWTGKFHLSNEDQTQALCGRTPSCIGPFKVRGDRAEFERVCPEKICKRCRRAEQAMWEDLAYAEMLA